MRAMDAQAKLFALNQPVIRTADAAVCLDVNRIHASKILKRLAGSGTISSIASGLWSLSKTLDPLVLPEYLTAPFPSYVSLQTALYYHGMISQIPSVIYAVTQARTRRYKTSFGLVSVHHISPDFFFDYSFVGNPANIKMATPEKALLDVLYLSPARSHLFKVLPEVEFPEKFDFQKAYKMIGKIKSPRRKSIVLSKFESIIGRLP